MKITWKFKDENSDTWASVSNEDDKFIMIYYDDTDEFESAKHHKDVLYVDSFVDRLVKWDCL